MSQDLPAIVIAVYDRVDSLNRLLRAIKRAQFPGANNIQLVFSADYGADKKVIELIDSFQWQFGEKRIIKHSEKLGLEENMLFCGSLAKEYQSVIVLEDDHFVAPYFYPFAQKALAFYKEDNKIAGVSLYNYQRNYQGQPFYPLFDGGDTFFLQKASTRGQAFSANQWLNFEKWRSMLELYEFKNLNIPPYLVQLADNNWEKLFNYYLIHANKYFVFPYQSHTTNFGEPGVHVKNPVEENAFQVPLSTGYKVDYTLQHIDDSKAVYDAFFEIFPEILRNYNDALKPYDFEVDLYGSKDPATLHRELILTPKKGENPIISFARNLKPHELNIINNLEGRDFSLLKKNQIKESTFQRWRNLLRTYFYYYPDIGLKYLLKVKILEIFSRIFRGLVK